MAMGKHPGDINQGFWQAVDRLIAESEIAIDRPRGSKHPRYDYVYPIDYGYLQNTSSPDGGGIDLWRGSRGDLRCDGIICTVDLLKRDSEIKLLLGCTEAERETILGSHNSSVYMKGVLVERGDCQ